MLLPTCGARSKYIRNHKYLFHHIGEKLFFQSRNFPSDPECISLGNNVMVAANVLFINHDITNALLNRSKGLKLKTYGGVIEVGDNVMIGANSIIMPNVRIGNNVVIAAGAIVTKDIPNNRVVGGIPAKAISTFDDLVNKRSNLKVYAEDGVDRLWEEFYTTRNLNQ